MSDRAAAIPRSSGVCCSSIVGEEEVASAECSTLVVEVDNKVNAYPGDLFTLNSNSKKIEVRLTFHSRRL